MYHVNMQLRWNPEKNEILKATRNVSFEQVAEIVEKADFIGPESNPAREGQMRIIVQIDGYPCVVPFVETDDGGWFLKTIYPCRKMKERMQK